ncbi:hypothetical protein TESG_03161 [Trichophyton tonsurans CBS 112818]|uniref:Uncharacterized protein n=1 Tax=Trichophyton tonsurans (strain CBS 112818) TaxID=647933 RepID=F2RWL8_TRIT1|nr:hypothetical protein TESG_03161 [Trichophyton tonsurans CBS 112818]
MGPLRTGESISVLDEEGWTAQRCVEGGRRQDVQLKSVSKVGGALTLSKRDGRGRRAPIGRKSEKSAFCDWLEFSALSSSRLHVMLLEPRKKRRSEKFNLRVYEKFKVKSEDGNDDG